MTSEATLPWGDRRGGDTGIAEYDGNPFINCLPPPPSDEDCFQHLVSMPSCVGAERELAPHLREQLVFIRVRQTFLPTQYQIRQAKQIDLMLRAGYVARNPATGAYQAQLTELAGDEADRMIGIEERRQKSGMAADSMVALGPSGIGKTTVVRRALDGYPQVVQHNAPVVGTVTQIVWMRVETAADGSPKQTILSMFAEIDRLIGTEYSEKFGALPRERLLVKAQTIFARHAIGLIVVDEIQNLSNSKAGHDDLMSFLTSLVNVINVPILMIGTMKAMGMMQSTFRTARRGEGNGSIIYEPLAMDNEWDTFIKLIFRLQWTRDPTPWSEELCSVLWQESQGIIDIAVKLFVLTQMRAIRTSGMRNGCEILTPELVVEVAQDSLKLVRPMLDALRRKDWKALQHYDDLGGLDAYIATELEKNYGGADHAPDLETLVANISDRLDGAGGEVAHGLLAAALAAQGIDVKQMPAFMEAIERVRNSAHPVAAVVEAELTKPKAKSRKVKGPPQPVDATDLRELYKAEDVTKALAVADLLDA